MRKFWKNFLIKWVIAASVASCFAGWTHPLGKAYAAGAEGRQEWDLEAARIALKEILAGRDVMALVYLDATQSLRSGASFDSWEVAALPTGQTVFLRDAAWEEDGTLWLYVETDWEGRTLAGYIPRGFLACADEAFLGWEAAYAPSEPGTAYGISREGQYADIEAFPASYQAALYSLKQKHPNWIFVRMDTGLWWDTVIDRQMQGARSLVYKTNPDYLKGPCYDDGNWYYATEGVLKYYMDPRNWLREDTVFQFELLTYNQTYQTEGAIAGFLGNTFMSSARTAPGTGRTFASLFWETGSRLDISPFHLAARVYQEQGRGDSPLISGTYLGYEGYYNYFNVRATGTSTKEVIENGLKYARANGWSNAYAAIDGGARLLSLYISKGQDTLYLQKYNVNRNSPYGLYEHQYMQNIAAPSSEGKKIMGMYREGGALGNTFVFKIPVYEGMPAFACALPTGPSSNPGTGWRQEEGGWYWYENNVRQGTEGRGKEIYDPGTAAWYWLDGGENGRRAENKDVYQPSVDGTGKWVRYGGDGRMIKGEDERYGGWYRFDEVTGAMVKGWYTTADGRKYYYDWDTGRMAHGYTVIAGKHVYFDYVTGVFADYAWSAIDGGDYWFEGGVKQGLEGRGKEIYDPGTNAWYWLDAVDGGRKAVSKDVYLESGGGAYADRPDGTGKWVRYDADGHMVKGWDQNGNGTYYFDPDTGAMAKGEAYIAGRLYYFNPWTGIQERGLGGAELLPGRA